MNKMKNYLKGGEKALSASTINIYIDCPLRFYFSSIEDMKDEEEVAEQVDNKEFGTLFHAVAEWIYKPLCGSVVTADLLKLRAKEQVLTEAIHRAFSEKFFRSKEVRSLSGQHYLTGEMIRKYALKLIENDCKLTPFRYIGSEEKIQFPFRLTNGQEIQLKGFIDRIDEVAGILRVVDYKTGAKKGMYVKSIENLFDAEDEKRQSAIFQVFMYAFVYWASRPCPYNAVQPVLYYVRDFFLPSFDPVITYGKEKTPVTDFAYYRDEFEDRLRSCLDNMFNPSIPFTQTVHTKSCVYCPFASVCGK